jgi:hypothetical protein
MKMLTTQTLVNYDIVVSHNIATLFIGRRWSRFGKSLVASPLDDGTGRMRVALA